MDFMSIYMSKAMKIKNVFKVYPSQIIDDEYFLGNANHCSDEVILRNLGITHIVNCTATLDNAFERKTNRRSSLASSSSFSLHTSPSSDDLDDNANDDNENAYCAEYCNVPVNDCPDQPINKHFVSAIKFIEEALAENGDGIVNRVLCHCHAGISRSTTIAIAYLMYARNISLVDALVMIKGRREIVNPNQGFRIQLVEFEKYLNEKRRLLKRDKLIISDLNDLNNKKSQQMDDTNKDEAENEEFLFDELKKRVRLHFIHLTHDDIDHFMKKYGSMINNQFMQIFGRLIEDILLNESNCNRQLFVLLIARMFELKQINNVNNSFIDEVLRGYLTWNLVENIMDSPYYLQFIASLIAQITHADTEMVQCLDL